MIRYRRYARLVANPGVWSSGTSHKLCQIFGFILQSWMVLLDQLLASLKRTKPRKENKDICLDGLQQHGTIGVQLDHHRSPWLTGTQQVLRWWTMHSRNSLRSGVSKCVVFNFVTWHGLSRVEIATDLCQNMRLNSTNRIEGFLLTFKK